MQQFMLYSFCEWVLKLAKLPYAPLNQRKLKILVVSDICKPHSDSTANRAIVPPLPGNVNTQMFLCPCEGKREPNK